MRKTLLALFVFHASMTAHAGILDWLVPTTYAPDANQGDIEFQERIIYREVVDLNSDNSNEFRDVGHNLIIDNKNSLNLTYKELDAINRAHEGYETEFPTNNPNEYIADEVISYLNNSEIEIFFSKLNLGEVARSERDYINLKSSLGSDSSEIQGIYNTIENMEHRAKDPNLQRNLRFLRNNVLVHYFRMHEDEDFGSNYTTLEAIGIGIGRGFEQHHNNMNKALGSEARRLGMSIKPAWQISRATFFKIPGEDKIKDISGTLSSFKGLNIQNAETAVFLANNSGDMLKDFFEFKNAAEKVFGKNANPTAADWTNFTTKKAALVATITKTAGMINENSSDFKPLGVAGDVGNAASAITSLLTSLDKYEEIAEQKKKLQLLQDDPQVEKLEYYLDITSDLQFKQVWSDITQATTSVISLTGSELITSVAEVSSIVTNATLDSFLETERARMKEWKDYYEAENERLEKHFSAMQKELLKAEQLVGKSAIEEQEQIPDLESAPEEPTLEHLNAHDFICSNTNFQTSSIGGCASTMANRKNNKFVDTTSTQSDNSKFIANDSSRLNTAYEQSILINDVTIAAGEWEVTQGDATKHLRIGDSFGSITAPNGRQIAGLNNADIPVAVMERTFTVPNGVRNINTSLLANFVTNEFPEYVGTEFNDVVQIDVITGSGNQYQIDTPFRQELNSASLTAVSGLPMPMDATGGQTGFTPVDVSNIPVAGGGDITIRVTSENVGDDLYPSAILISDTSVVTK